MRTQGIRKTLVWTLGLLLLSPISALAETRAERDGRMAWWREARFGMFVHWGLFQERE